MRSYGTALIAIALATRLPILLVKQEHKVGAATIKLNDAKTSGHVNSPRLLFVRNVNSYAL